MLDLGKGESRFVVRTNDVDPGRLKTRLIVGDEDNAPRVIHARRSLFLSFSRPSPRRVYLYIERREEGAERERERRN